MENVFSWNEALENDCEPRRYSYKDVIIGTINATLDFKIWSKESTAVVCYFSDIESGTKFQISVFGLKGNSYKLKDCDLDFTSCPIREEYQLTIEKNGKGNPFLKGCILVSGGE